MRTASALLAACVLALAACSDGDDADAVVIDDDSTSLDEDIGLTLEEYQEVMDTIVDAPTCADVFTPGAPAPDLDTEGMCIDGNGFVAFIAAATLQCDDGRTLHQTDDAWWIEGETILEPREDTDANVDEVCGN